jgi:3-phenylpropionate/trans-cinnamate dioxygenase ferredoxin reductase subunit
MASVQSSSPSAGSPGADGVLIVGGGQAAVHLASSLRDLNWQAAVTIVSEEDHAPYQRPPLSKAFLSGNAQVTTLEFRSAEHYERDRITVLTGQRVTDVRAAAPGRPGVAITADSAGLKSGRLEFGHLALATGARPRRLAVPGADLAGICYLRDLGHALELRERLAAAQRVLVVGGGFIGLEAAASATAKGKAVTVVEAADRLIGRVVAPEVSDFYAAAHRRRGVRVLLGTGVAGFAGTAPANTGPANTGPASTGPASTGGTVTGAHLSDGGFVPADLVIIGIGAEPRTELAERLGLACAGGIVTDAFARTSDPAIVAAGDCAVTPHPAAADGSLVRFESYGHAIDHAKVAAATLAGVPASYDAVPWFWSDQGTLKLQIAGLSGGFDQAVLRGDPGEEKFSVLYYRDGRLLAVHAVNCPRDYLAVRRALAAGQEIPAESAADAGQPLRPAGVGV